jgi:hypothetical protein
MADGTKDKADDQCGVSCQLSSPAALTELARLLARQAAQAHFTAREGKSDSHHDQTD